ncbi:Nramp family divalent metal transporter [Parvularcula sp. LCG005]|uniref:Nramp family divalent metal transporter n=1 Tax=Parvularcula sp. LCG005 TaxID=3078805 RepID=UPI0029437976|nr:Nramp family divalent metal transporter [Parvularcula sp. LCG005]WOI53930.1 Nramp family divalent metal transporter [Parvularcula sp. LCG005]
MKLKIGPGALVAAAFIGPGTVTTCTLAGANFGFALLWALVFATMATIVLQDMAARLGAGGGLGLAEALGQMIPVGPARWLMMILVLTAIGLGNAAYEAGNLMGGTLGLNALIGRDTTSGWHSWPLVLSAGVALALGRYQMLERILIGLVIIMALAFVAAAVLVHPSLSALLAGLRPAIPEGGLLTTIALIGTTIVPYNLFLHASAARQRWAGGGDVGAARSDTAVSVSLGGVVSILVLATAATALFGQALSIQSAGDMARSLEPTFGPMARVLIGAGLLAAGLTSAITAPLAAGFVVAEFFGRDETSSRRLRVITSLAILLIGTVIGFLGIRPVTLILVAQAANGLLLPIIAVFLLWVMNRRGILGAHANSLASNLAGSVVVLVAVLLGLRGVARALGIWP